MESVERKGIYVDLESLEIYIYLERRERTDICVRERKDIEVGLRNRKCCSKNAFRP